MLLDICTNLLDCYKRRKTCWRAVYRWRITERMQRKADSRIFPGGVDSAGNTAYHHDVLYQSDSEKLRCYRRNRRDFFYYIYDFLCLFCWLCIVGNLWKKGTAFLDSHRTFSRCSLLHACARCRKHPIDPAPSDSAWHVHWNSFFLCHFRGSAGRTGGEKIHSHGIFSGSLCHRYDHVPNHYRKDYRGIRNVDRISGAGGCRRGRSSFGLLLVPD